MLTWSDRIKSSKKPERVQLHVDRWKAWEEFFDFLIEKGWEEILEEFKPRKSKIPSKETAFENKVIESGKTWAHRMFRHDTPPDVEFDDFVEFDAGFGSMNPPSDLDVNVVSTTSDVLDHWMEYTRSYVKATNVGSFCEYWDSNFYYAPGLINGGRLFGYLEHLSKLGFRWTTPDTALYELQCVDAYTRAYEEVKDIIVDGYKSRPNPEGISSAKEQDIYHANLEMGEKFRKACEDWLKGGSADAVRYAYLQYAVTKVEGLVCVTSLAICKVLGEEFFVEYVNKEDPDEDPDNPSEFKKWFKPYMAGISAYEMLRNLQMHVHDGMYKSKYAKRLIWVLLNNKGLCKSHEPRSKLARKATMEEWDDDPAKSITKNNTSSIHDIAKAIGFLLDFMDGIDEYDGECDFMNSDEWESNLGETLDKLCVMTKKYVEGLIKEETSEKQKGVDYVKNLVPEPNQKLSQ